MPTRVKLQDGSIAEFPDGMSPQDIQGAIEHHQSTTASTPTPAPSAHPYLDAAENFGKGIVKSGIGLMSSADNAVSKIPVVGNLLTTPIGQKPSAANSAAATQYAQQLAQPHGTAQVVGKAVGNVGQFLIPGDLEAEAAAKLGPSVGKLAAKVLPSAVASGVVNKAQGGSFTGGAIAGGAGQALAHGLAAVAPHLAESALGVRGMDRQYGRTPGEYILDETTGMSPRGVADQAAANTAGATEDLNKAAWNSPANVSLYSPRDAQGGFQQVADLQNNKETIRDVARIGEQLNVRNGEQIPESVPAYEALALKRGLSALTQYNPNAAGGLADAAVKGTIKSMEPGLSSAIPGYEDYNSLISNGIPVAKRAEATDLNAGWIQRGIHRLSAHTGALALPIGGALAGGAAHGPAGALLGGIGTLAGTELATSPTTWLAAARAANAPVTATTLRAIPKILLGGSNASQ